MAPRKGKALEFIVEGAKTLESAVAFSLRPGLNFFEGANGAGKTALIGSALAWAGRRVAVPVADGAEKVKVYGPQCVVEIGRSRKADGSPSVVLVADDAFACLIDPGLKEPKARAKARTEALLHFRPVAITEDLLLRLCGGDSTVAASVQGKHPDWHSLTLDEAAEAARLCANAMAKPLEEDAQRASGAANSLLRQAEALAEDIEEVPEEPASALADQVEGVTRSLGEMRVAAKGRRELEEQQGALRGTLGPRPDLKGLEIAVTIAEEEVAELQEKLRAAEQRQGAARAALKAAEREDRAWMANDAILSKPLSGPTVDDLERTEQALSDLKAKLAAAEKEERRVKLKKDATAHLDASRAAQAKAAALRAIAQTVKADVGNILAELGLEGVTFINGELAVETPTGPRPVEELSFGERVDFGLKVALPAYREADLPPIFWLREAFWYALQPKKQDALESMAKQEGIYFAIERPTDGQLEVRNRPAKDVRPVEAAS